MYHNDCCQGGVDHLQRRAAITMIEQTAVHSAAVGAHAAQYGVAIGKIASIPSISSAIGSVVGDQVAIAIFGTENYAARNLATLGTAVAAGAVAGAVVGGPVGAAAGATMGAVGEAIGKDEDFFISQFQNSIVNSEI